MAAITTENRDAWQDIANSVSKQRPYPGRRVRVLRGRKHRGKEGVVLRHEVSRYSDAFRYGGDANLHMREMAGRDGFRIQVRPDDGRPFWINAEYVQCIDDAAGDTVPLDIVGLNSAEFRAGRAV